MDIFPAGYKVHGGVWLPKSDGWNEVPAQMYHDLLSEQEEIAKKLRKEFKTMWDAMEELEEELDMILGSPE